MCMYKQRFFCSVALAIVFCWSVAAGSVSAQQVLVDDAEITPPRSAQIEVWHGWQESWILPAVQLIPRLELSAGTAFVREEESDLRSTEYGFEGKVSILDPETAPAGLAAVVGTGVTRLGLPKQSPETVYAFVPASQELIDDRLTVYQNVGWAREDGGPSVLTWGARIDVTPIDRFTLIGEVFGEGEEPPAFQTALRTEVIPERLEVDLSLTRSEFAGDTDYWVTAGITLVSPSIY